MHQGGGGTGHGHGGHGGHGGHQQQGQHSHHHGHLNGGIPANSPSDSVNWANAMNGEQEKFWVTLFKKNKLRLLAVSSIGLFFVMWLFVIDYSNQKDRDSRNGPGNAWAQQHGSETSMPMQASATSVSALPSESGIPSAFGAPRNSFEVSASPQFYPNHMSSVSTVSQATNGGYPSGVPGSSQSFGAPAPCFGRPQETVPARTHAVERYRMVVNR
jgi:hypothetical protein